MPPAALPRKRREAAPSEAPPAQKPRVSLPPPSSNWKAIREQIGAGRGAPRRAPAPAAPPSAAAASGLPPRSLAPPAGADRSLTRVVALDCEMVGTGPGGSRSALARAVVVNAHGAVLLDTHCRPAAEVTDYRTEVSGVSAAHLAGAPPLAEVQARVAALLSGRLLVGHGLRNDLKALLLSHPRGSTRDTARYPPLMRSRPHVGGPSAEARRGRPARLQDLAAEQLGVRIQGGAHDPAEDARAALALYARHAKEWEMSLTAAGRARDAAARAEAAAGRRAERAAAAARREAAAAAAEAAAADGSGGAAGAEGAAQRPQQPPPQGKGGAQQPRRPQTQPQPPARRGAGGWSELLARASSRGAAA